MKKEREIWGYLTKGKKKKGGGEQTEDTHIHVTVTEN